MDRFNEFLKKTECCFNWDLSELEVSHHDKVTCALDYFKEKLLAWDSVETEDPHGDWPLRLVYAYELFDTDQITAMQKADEVIQEVRALKDRFTLKYQVPFFHIVYSTKAVMLVRSEAGVVRYVENLVGLIKPKSDMSKEERSGLMAMKAHMMRLYGPDGTHKSVPLLKEALRLNPLEVEWSLSLVVSQTRIRHYLRSELSLEDIRESEKILNELLERPDLTPTQKVTAKYYLAVAYHDCHKRGSEVRKICEEICNQTEHPSILAFCAKKFGQRKGIELIEKGLKKFPTHVGLNTTAANLYKNLGQHCIAAKYAQTAMENGGYGAAWLFLGCKIKLGGDFDEEEFFTRMLSSFQSLYAKQTHVGASMYYFCQKQDVLKGAFHMEQAIKEDPEFKGIHEATFDRWAGRKVRPIELAYSQIVRSLRKDRDNQTLLRVKRVIEDAAGDACRHFSLADDLGPRTFQNSRAQGGRRKL